MKAIVIGPSDEGLGEGGGIYYLMAEDGEVLCSHLCSNIGYARGDLYGHRPERKEMFDKKGITEFVLLKDSGFSFAELKERNNIWYEKNKDKVDS